MFHMSRLRCLDMARWRKVESAKVPYEQTQMAGYGEVAKSGVCKASIGTDSDGWIWRGGEKWSLQRFHMSRLRWLDMARWRKVESAKVPYEQTQMAGLGELVKSGVCKGSI